MKHLFLTVISSLLLISCSKKEPAPAPEPDSSWNGFVDYVKADPMQEYTKVIFRHSIEKSARISPGIVTKCSFGKDGMTKLEFKSLLEFDYNRGRQCWDSMVSYPKADHRFSVEGTQEYEAWRNFWERRDDYTPLFDMF